MPVRTRIDADCPEPPDEIVVLLGRHEEWPADLANRLVDEGFGVVAVQNVALLETLVLRSPARTVLIDLRTASNAVWAALRRLRTEHPDVALVGVATVPERFDAEAARSRGVTAWLSWPTTAEALRLALRARTDSIHRRRKSDGLQPT